MIGFSRSTGTFKNFLIKLMYYPCGILSNVPKLQGHGLLPTSATFPHQTLHMTRLLAILALGAGALYFLEETGTVRISSGGGGSGGAIGAYANSSAPAIEGIIKGAGG